MLVLLEKKGYLTRKQGLSRGLCVGAVPSSAAGELSREEQFALLALSGWLAVARDAELMMAARVDDIESKSKLIDNARERHHEFCQLESAIDQVGDIATVDPRSYSLADELLSRLPRCESWDSFVIDELVCNRVSSRIAEYASRTRPAVRGLLWRQGRFAQAALACSQRWADDLVDTLPGQQEFDVLASRAKELAYELYRMAETIDGWSEDGLSLLSPGIDPEEAGALV